MFVFKHHFGYNIFLILNRKLKFVNLLNLHEPLSNKILPPASALLTLKQPATLAVNLAPKVGHSSSMPYFHNFTVSLTSLVLQQKSTVFVQIAFTSLSPYFSASQVQD